MTASVASRVMTTVVNIRSNTFRSEENTVVNPVWLNLSNCEGGEPRRPCRRACRLQGRGLLQLHSSAEFDGLVDQFGSGRNGLAELLIHALAGGDEGVLVGIVHFHAGRLDLLEQFAAEALGRLIHEGLNVLGGLRQDF